MRDRSSELQYRRSASVRVRRHLAGVCRVWCRTRTHLEPLRKHVACCLLNTASCACYCRRVCALRHVHMILA
ncbi:hypothetical protein BDW22DRAFT_225734 [Trametopsis cervina]|nr:hypothetical protein BDW22DRAFT_225734 [Trametopsis cervina]